jgi:hypothetical protein
MVFLMLGAAGSVSKRFTLTGTVTKENWKFESNPPAWFRRLGVGRADFARSIG